MRTQVLSVTGLANGGEGVARDDTGRVVFVRGALPGERVRVEVTDARRSFARARLVDVVESSPDRRTPPCPNVAAGCGGCDLQHLAPEAGLDAKVSVVVDTLERIGRVAHIPPIRSHALPETGYRTTVRVASASGRPAHRRRASNDLCVIDECRVLHPRLEELLDEIDLGRAGEATLRTSVADGDRLVVVDSPDAGVRAPDGVRVVEPGEPASYGEVVAGRRLRVSARSFFQVGPVAAEALVAEVTTLVGEAPRRLADLYGGVGLFAATVDSDRVVLVEQSAQATDDAVVNLSHRDATVVRRSVERWAPESVDTVIADPPRRGLRAAGADAIAGTHATRVVLVSCDPASFGRDAALLIERGYVLVDAVVVDQFAGTSHIESVARFDAR